MIVISTLLVILVVLLRRFFRRFLRSGDMTHPNYGKKRPGRIRIKKHPTFFNKKRPFKRLQDHEYTVPNRLLAVGLIFKKLGKPVYGVKVKEKYKMIKHKELVKMSKSFLSGLLSVVPGLEKGSKVGIYLDTCLEYMTTLYGLHFNSIVGVQCYPNLGAEGLKYVITECQLKVLVTSADNLVMVEKVAEKCATLEYVIVVPTPGLEDVKVETDGSFEAISYGSILERGETPLADVTEPGPDDLACIMYTSGVELKGVLLTHKNLICGMHQYVTAVDQHPDDVYYSYLPVSHILELCAHLVFVMGGSTTYFGTPSTMLTRRGVKGDLELCQPTRLCVVPKILDRVKKGVNLSLSKSNFLVRWLFNFYVSRKLAAFREGKNPYLLGEEYIFGKVRKMFGRRMDYFMSGGSPLSAETQLWFKAVLGPKFDVCNGYGLTETSACIGIQPRQKWDGNLKTLTFGYIVGGIDAKVIDVPELDYFAKDNFGELVVKGDMVTSGYYKKPEVTKEAFDEEGYFRTGDVVRVNCNGTISIIGTKKTIVKLSHGEYVPVTVLERLYETSPFIFTNGFCIFANSYKPFIVAVAVIDIKFVKLWAEQKKVKYSSEEELLGNERLERDVLQNLKELGLKNGRNIYECVQNILLTKDKWTTENGLLTEELGFKRKAMKEKYGEQVLCLFEKDPFMKVGKGMAVNVNLKSDEEELDLPAVSEIEKLLLEVAIETMGLSEDEISINTNLFDAGMTSLMLKQIYVKLPKEMQRFISATDLYSSPTVGGVARTFFLNMKRSKENPVFKQVLEVQNAFDDDFAIVGMSCIVPGARNLEEFWENLRSQTISVDFAENEAVYAMKGKKEFDHSLFDIPISIARIMNPGYRKYLEMVFHCLEDAGYDPMRFSRENKVGAFCSMSDSFYLTDLFTNIDSLPLQNKHTLLSYNSQLFFSGFLGYYLNFCGPTLFVGSACSSGVSALKVAMNSVAKHECQMAIVGGVSTKDFDKYGAQDLPMQSSDGHNRAFDHRASGTIFGEGGGCVLIKPLKAALRDKDHVYCVIKSAFVNNDGHDSKKMSFVAPSIEGQMDVIENAYIHAGINPNTVRYLESHGTGTDIGDVVEMEALKRVFRNYTSDKGFIQLGAVKNNISHLDNAAGIVGVIKAALVLDRKLIPGIAGYQKPNPLLRIDDSPFVISTKNVEWEGTEEFPRRAGVSSFGMGGNNAHVLLEEVVVGEEENDPAMKLNLMLLSAKSQDCLDEMKDNFLEFLKSSGDLNMSDVALTLQVGRRDLPFKKFFVCESQDDAINILSENSENTQINKRKPEVKLVFMYPGMGSQYWRMSADIYDTHTAYKEVVDKCIESVKNETGIDFSGFFQKEKDEELEKLVYQIPYSQLYLFIVEYSLTTFLDQRLGTKPDYVMGHSFGEIIAAIVSGMFTFEEGIKIIVKRAELTRQLKEGRMLSINSTDFDSVENAIRQVNEKEGVKVEIAVINSPKNVVVSGTPEGIDQLKSILEMDYKMFTQMLKNDRGFHSFLVDPMVEELQNFMEFFYTSSTRDRSPKMGFVSTALGKIIQESSAEYWGRQLREKVLFTGAVNSILERESSRVVFVEVGPSVVLSKLVRANQIGTNNFCVSLCRHPKLVENDERIFLKGIGSLWSYGVDSLSINWDKLYESKRGRVSLPLYPFEKKKCWVDFEKTIFFKGEEDFPGMELDEIQLLDTKKTVTCEREEILVKSILSGIQKKEKKAEGRKNVLLTGCTGLLGGFILKELLEKFPTVYCLVRNQSLGKMEKYAENSNVRVVPGDLATKRFGLSNEKFEELVSNIDIIVHCGANAKLAMLSDLYNVNVRSLFDIIELSEGYKPIYYVSTVAVYSNFPPPKSKTLENEVHVPFNGYGSSKYVVDSLLTKIYPNVSIFRCCPLISTAPGVDPNKQIETDVMMSILKIVDDMGVSPDLESIDVALNLLPATYVASRIVGVVEDSCNTVTKQVFNVSYRNVTLKNLIEMLAKVRLKKFPAIPLKQWVAAVEEKYDDNRILSAKWIFQLIVQKQENGFTSDCSDEDFALDMKPLDVSGVAKYAEMMKNIKLKTTEQMKKEIEGEGKDFDDVKSRVEKIWKDLFQLQNIKSRENFFELGGDSLLFTELINNVEKKFSTKIKLSEFYKQPTIENMARILTKSVSSSVMQKRFLNLKKPDSVLKKQDFAIIGMCCKFPGADTIPQFWDNLMNQVVSMKEVDGRLHYIINERDRFDYEFFTMSKATSIITSPTYRIFLEMCYHCLEDAGYDLQREDSKKFGLFSSVGDSNYFSELVQNVDHLPIKNIPVIYNMNSPHTFSGFVSYNLDIKGPSFSVSSACSSTLLAVRIACENIMLGKCEMALVGGLKIKDLELYSIDKIAMESEDCKNRAFDHRSGGTVFGEGGGVVMIKTLEQAKKDGDYIYSVIRGSSMNNDGYDINKKSFAAPSFDGQKRVIEDALMDSGVDPESIGYIECHGTATRIGDSVEFDALRAVFEQYSQKKNYIRLGAVKNNISHLDNSAGIAGLIKTCLVVQKGLIPGNANFEKVNRFIEIEGSPFTITNENSVWKTNSKRVAGVSSFGMGGNNSHVVVEQFDMKRPERVPNEYELLLFSAKSEESLKVHLGNYSDLLKDNPFPLMDVAYTLMVGRRELPLRKFQVVNKGDVKIDHETVVYREALKDPKVVFMFPGMGSQYPTMTLDLYENDTVFASHVDACVETAVDVLGIDLGFFFDRSQTAKMKEFCYKNNFAQMYLFVVEYALARTLIHYGVEPDYIMGHSFGEYVGGVVAGVFNLADGMKVVHDTAVVMEKLEKGLMLSISSTDMEGVLEEMEAVNLGEVNLQLSVINSPKNFVISGRVGPIQKLKAVLEAKKITCRLLHTPNAYHCFLMDPVVSESCEIVKKFKIMRHKIPFVSAVTGDVVKTKFSSEYWGRHLREKVEFSKTVQKVMEITEEDGVVFVEVGPHMVLNKLVREQKLSEQQHVVCLGKHPKLKDNEFKVFLTALGDIWSSGARIDFRAFCEGRGNKLFRVPLPHYPFKHSEEISYEKKFVPQKKMFRDLELLGKQRKSSMKGKKVNFTCTDTWQNLVSFTTLPWLEAHIFQDVVIVPGASWVSLYLELSQCVEDIHFHQVLKVTETDQSILQTVKDEEGRMRVFSKPFDQPDAKWTLRSDGLLSTMPKKKPTVPQHVLDFMKRLDTCKYFDHKTFYARFKEIDFNFGEIFKCIQEVWIGDEETFCKVLAVRPDGLPIENFMVQPVIMDNFLQCVFGTTHYITETFLPNNIEKIVVYDPKFPTILNCHCVVTDMNEDFITADYVIFDDDNKVFMEIFSFRGINLKRRTEREINADIFELHWQRKDMVTLGKSLSVKESEEKLDIEEELKQVVQKRGVEALKEKKEETSLFERFFAESATIRSSVSHVLVVLENLLAEVVKRDPKQVLRILDLESSGFIAEAVVPFLKSREGLVEYILKQSGELLPKSKETIKDYDFVSFRGINVDVAGLDESEPVEDDSIDIVLGFQESDLANLAPCLVRNGVVILLHPNSAELEMLFGKAIEIEELKKKFDGFTLTTYDVNSLSVVFAQKKEVLVKEEKVEFETFFEKDPLSLVEFVKKLEEKEKVNLLVFFEDVLRNPDYAEVYGMAKVLKNEYPDWDVRLINLVGNANLEEVKASICANPELYENECCVDETGKIYVPRVVKSDRHESEDKETEDEEIFFHIKKKEGGLKNVISFDYLEFERPQLFDRQILVKIHCSPINFRDVLILMSLLIDETTQNVGYEFSGTIIDVGPKCTKFKVGDPVFGFGTCTYGSYAVSEEPLVALKPDFLSFQQAASIPMAFCTAYFCLFDLGKVEKGDRVLVHSAAGNVGQAVIQFCNNIGAEIFATVGSQAKRDYLREKYDVTRFADSHSEDWDLEMKQLCPEGFDIIINSLRGQGIKRGVVLLKERGRFCEIGWRDIVDNMSMGLRRFIRNVSFTAFNLKRIGEDKYKQHQINESLEAMLPMFQKGTLKTTIDKEFDISDVKSGYRYLLKNEYLGKIIINVVKDDKTIIPKDLIRTDRLFKKNKSYIVSGGLGGLGVELFKYLAKHGAGKVVLLSRSGKTTKKQRKAFVSVKREYNCEIVVSKTDVSDEESVKELYSREKNVGGVFHLAVVYNDMALNKVDAQNYSVSVKAKKDGALNLLNLNKGLEFFFSFSTMATVVGNPGQSAYAAANIFCEILAQHMQEKNINAYALCVPNIIDVGVIARDHVIRRKMRIAGLLETGLTSDELFDYVSLILKRRKSEKKATFMTKYDFDTFFDKSNLKVKGQVSHLCSNRTAATGLKERKQVTYDTVNAIVKDVISSQLDIDPNKYLAELGVDSLTAVELSSVLKAEFGVIISQMDLVSGLTINKILELAKKQFGDEEEKK